MSTEIKRLIKEVVKREQRLINERKSYKYSPKTINVFSAVLISERGLWIDFTPGNQPYLKLNSQPTKE